MKFEGINYFIFSSILLRSLDKKQEKVIINYLKTGNDTQFKNILLEENINALLTKYIKQYGTQNTSVNLTNNTTNLYDICCMFYEAFNFLKRYTCSGVLKNGYNVNLLSFSIGKNYGCAIKIKNANNEDFYCVLYGASSFKALEEDIENIKTWLVQFFTYKVSISGEKIAEIPVFYGEKDSCIASIKEEHFVILSKYLNKNITKTSVYRTMLEAPVMSGENIGVVTYNTSIFKNNIIKYILTDEHIEKANKLKIILDSIAYIIFGSPYRKTKICKSEDY
jgi:hypothetical protein